MAIEQDTQFLMRASKEWLKQLDDWRRLQPDMPARAVAIRRLVRLGMDVPGLPTREPVLEGCRH